MFHTIKALHNSNHFVNFQEKHPWWSNLVEFVFSKVACLQAILWNYWKHFHSNIERRLILKWPWKEPQTKWKYYLYFPWWCFPTDPWLFALSFWLHLISATKCIIVIYACYLLYVESNLGLLRVLFVFLSPFPPKCETMFYYVFVKMKTTPHKPLLNPDFQIFLKLRNLQIYRIHIKTY